MKGPDLKVIYRNSVHRLYCLLHRQRGSSMRIRNWRLLLIAAASLAIVSAGVVRWRVGNALRESARELTSNQEMRFSVGPVPTPVDRGFEWISAPASFAYAATFQGKLYVCGPAGLLEFDNTGKLLKHYRAGLELPASPLIRMSQATLADAHEPELLIATSSEGVLAFNGKTFRQIRPETPEARSITSILPLSSGHLLIGTQKRGLLVYDGKSIHSFHASVAALKVTELAGSESDLWIGTLDSGVFHWRGGRVEQFSEAQGLPDPQIYSIAVAGEEAYVGTALGIAEFNSGRFVRTLARGVFARTLAVFESKLLVGGIDQSIGEVELQPHRVPGPLRSVSRSDLGEIKQIFSAESNTYSLSQSGLYSREKHGGWRRVLAQDATLLHDRNVSALALDRGNRLWVGYFDRGLDVIDSNGRAANHIENDHIFCVNRIVPQSTERGMAVATANGLVLFDELGKQQQVLSRSDGLIADHVTDALPYRDGMVVATPAGLTFLDSGGARSLYAFHGLVNNHVYALAGAGDYVLAGTLGGISVLNHEKIVANYTSATPGLKHNWISAIVPVGREWMVGTYGAGIIRLSENGKFESFDIATDKFEVNPNAMLVTEHHVLAGTLGKGLYSYNREAGKWSIVAEGLPSANVTALTAGNGYIYVGTDNGLVRVPENNLP
jgi:ligand-binding sensor domain-containing protein